MFIDKAKSATRSKQAGDGKFSRIRQRPFWQSKQPGGSGLWRHQRTFSISELPKK